MAQNTFQVFKCGPPPAHGQMQRYPGRFKSELAKYYPEVLHPQTIHLFSGSCDWGKTCDMRETTKADFVCDFRDLPNQLPPGQQFEHCIADPPYNDMWHGEWIGSHPELEELPKPKQILSTAAQIVKPGGLVLILHIILVPDYQDLPVKRIDYHPVLAGPNNALRGVSVFKVLNQQRSNPDSKKEVL